MNPSEILFSTPSLNDALPAVGAAPADPTCIRIHEDDWRQFEFVASMRRRAVERELAAIDRIWAESSVPVGDYAAFREVHVRSAVAAPLDLPWTMEEFDSTFATTARQLSFWDWNRVLSNVAVASLQGLLVYAEFRNNLLACLGLQPSERFVLPDDVASRLERFAKKHQLTLVHWPSRTLFDGPEAAMRYLRGKPE